MRKKVKYNKRPFSFKVLKCVMRFKYRKPKFVFLGEKITNGSLILSNHEASFSPSMLAFYLEAPLRMWGTYEMNSGLKTMYKYQTRIYYHQKHGWNLGLARTFCLIASPITNVFYRGAKFIQPIVTVGF